LSLRRRPAVLASALAALLAAPSSPARADAEVEALAMATGVIVLASLITDMPEREEPDAVALEVGRFDAVKKVQPATAFSGEFRVGRLLWWDLRPFVGAGVTSRQSLYGYGGIRLATYWGERIVLTPSFAVGGYSRGEGKDLGNPAVVGRFGIDLEYRFDNAMRLGVAYHHFSNGKAFGQSVNPGTEVIGLTFLLPLR